MAGNLVYWHRCRLSSISIFTCYTKFDVVVFNTEVPPSNALNKHFY
jgi:hypothetical protein